MGPSATHVLLIAARLAAKHDWAVWRRSSSGGNRLKNPAAVDPLCRRTARDCFRTLQCPHLTFDSSCLHVRLRGMVHVSPAPRLIKRGTESRWDHCETCAARADIVLADGLGDVDVLLSSLSVIVPSQTKRFLLAKRQRKYFK